MVRKTKAVSRRKKVVKRKRGKGNSKSFVTALRKLSSLQPSQRLQAVKLSNDKFIRDFCHNMKKLRYQSVSPKLQKQLRHHSKKLRKLVSTKTNIKTKRKMLSQRGSGLLSRGLMGALAGALTAALGRR